MKIKYRNFKEKKLLHNCLLHFNKIKERINKRGILRTFCGYFQSIINLLYGRMIFGRWDVNIFPDSRLGGVDCMCIGSSFYAGRGLWLEAVTNCEATGQLFAPQLIIGNNVCIGEYVHIGCNSKILIGDDVLMGSKIYITDHNHGVYSGENADSPFVSPIKRRLTEGESVEIGARCWIGEFVTILPGVTIGEGCIIGSHSTVTHDIPKNSIAVGSPARVVKVWDEEAAVWRKV